MPQYFARYAAAAVIVFLGALALDFAQAKSKPLLPMAICFFALLAPGLVTDIKTGGGTADFALTAAESILGAGSAFFFYRALNCNLNRLRFKSLPLSDTVCIVISAALLLMSLSQTEIFGISPARALAAAAVLIIVRYDSELSGLMLALAAGFALSLQSADSLFLTGAYGFSALLGCLFCQFGTPATAGAFTLSFALFNVAFGADASYFAEAAIGCGAVAVLPRVLSEKIRSFFHDGADITPDGSPNIKNQMIVIPGSLFGIHNPLKGLTFNFINQSNGIDPHPLTVQVINFFVNKLDHQIHQSIHFFGRPFPILCGKKHKL